MNNDQKAQFITSLCDAIRDNAISKIGIMPDEWNGHELRQYLADKFAREISSLMREKRSRRLREYRNIIATTNL